MLQQPTTQGDGIIAWITQNGFYLLLVAMLVVLGLIVLAVCRRTNANSRGNEKKF